MSVAQNAVTESEGNHPRGSVPGQRADAFNSIRSKADLVGPLVECWNST